MVDIINKCRNVGLLAREILMSGYECACSLLVPYFELNLPLLFVRVHVLSTCLFLQ